MEFKYLIVFAVCTSVCFGDCIPDRLPESANFNNSSSSMLVGNARPINVSSDRVVQLIHFLNEYKYNVSAPNDNLLIVTCNFEKFSSLKYYCHSFIIIVIFLRCKKCYSSSCSRNEICLQCDSPENHLLKERR